MATRKRKAKKQYRDPEELTFNLFPKDKRPTIWETMKQSTTAKIFEADKIFSLLLLSGCSNATAYRYAYGTEATTNGCATMGCRKRQDKQIQAFIGSVLYYYWGALVRLDECVYKGNKKRLWANYLGKKVKHLRPEP